MIAVRSLIGSSTRSKSRAPKARSSQPTGNLVRGLGSVGRIPNVGTNLVGRPAVGEPVVRTLPTKSTMGPNPLATNANRSESIAERECGA